MTTKPRRKKTATPRLNPSDPPLVRLESVRSARPTTLYSDSKRDARAAELSSKKKLNGVDEHYVKCSCKRVIVCPTTICTECEEFICPSCVKKSEDIGMLAVFCVFCRAGLMLDCEGEIMAEEFPE